MMNDWKTGLKLMRYAYGIKMNCVQAGVFFLAGLVWIVSGEKGSFGLMGGFFWTCIAILPTQLIYTLGVAGLVQASPMGKKVQTIFPVGINLANMAVVYLAELALWGIQIRTRPEQAGEAYLSLLVLAAMMAVVMIYLGICYKYFVAATLILVPTMVAWMGGGLEKWARTWLSLGERDMSFGLAAAIGFGILAAGGLVEYLLTLLFYRAPLSKMAQAAPLRKYLT